MFTELWQNKGRIFKNYTSILYTNRVGLSVIATLLGLIIIYAYMRYQEFNLHWQLLGPTDSGLPFTFRGTGVPTVPSSPNYSYTPKGCDNGTNVVALGCTINRHPTVHDGQCKGIVDDNGEILDEGFEVNPGDNNQIKFNLSFIIPGSAESKTLYSVVLQYYLSGFNQPNIQARGFDTKAELDRTYKTMIIPITKAEESMITYKLSSILDQIPGTKLAKVSSWISRASIAKGAKWLESGMPHTHGNTMIMNANWFTNTLGSTYFHELFHIIQRNNPDRFENLYIQNWDFKKVAGGAKSILGLETQLSLARMNPDANDFCWIWLDNTTGKYYWINAIFIESAPKSLLAVQYLAYPVIRQQDGRTFRYLGSQAIKLNSLTPFVNMFGIGYNHYHPNEIASQYAEYYFVADSSQIPQEIKNKPAYRAFSSWLEVANL
jgi:hypothetical protein